jgi:hypothetical protein
MKKTFLIVSLASFLFAACCTCSITNEDNHTVPKNIRMKADEFVISKTGKDFFDENINPDYQKTTKIKDGYLLIYNFSIPEKQIDAIIKFSIDTLGNILESNEVTGIPECITNPENCSFISKEEAIKIATNSGLEKGVKDWDIKFTWDPSLNKYLWDITSTIRETKGENIQRASGKTLLIDPNNGEIIKTNLWQIN